MGLDISLYPKAAAEANAKNNEIWVEDDEGNYPAKTMTDEERKAWNEANPYVRHADVPSVKYPDHLCNRTYLRSSYNSGGFNSRVHQILGEDSDFYWIFEPLGRDWRNGEDEEPLTAADIPGLQEARTRALAVAQKLNETEPLAAMTVSHNILAGISDTNDEEAIAIYRSEKERALDGWYGKGNGDFFMSDPPTILAAIAGKDVLGSPAVHLIYRLADIDWYIQTAEITAEFCEEAISLIEKDGSCEISWSG